MNKTIFLLILFFFNSNMYAKSFDTNNLIKNLKYGFTVGDIIIIQDEIISDTKFLVTPKLIITKNKDLQLINQFNRITKEAGKYHFINEISYQVFLKSKSGEYELPAHVYIVDKDKILMKKNSFWFTRISESKLNDVLVSSIDQKKMDLLIIDDRNFYILCILSLFSILIILYKNIDIPYFKRMNGPFSKAHKRINALHNTNNKENYLKSILILTDAFNKTFKTNITNSNFEKLISKNNKYLEIKNEIGIFINVSSIEIYSSNTYFTKIRFNEIFEFTKTLRKIERKA